jgi:hypothetical protein
METNDKKKFDLDERLIEFAVLIIQLTDSMIDTRAGSHIGGQIVRSGTHPALHYCYVLFYTHERIMYKIWRMCLK